jgi:putative membrane protein
LFESAANDATLDPEMRALAKKTLPTLEQHLADAQKLEARLAE